MTARERAIAVALIVATLAALGFIAAYAFGGNRLYEGLTLAIAAASLCAAALGHALWLLPSQQVVDVRDDYPSTRAQRLEQTREEVAVETSVTRRTTLLRLMYVALGAFASALVVPIRSFGSGGIDALFHTKWRPGSRLVRPDGRAVHRDELNVDSVVTVFPQDAIGDARSQAVLIRLPGDLDAQSGGYVAYSRVCTHAGCAIALYRASAKQLMCPCHQSIFDAVGDGAVVSGPADRPLPRLPIAFDAHGYAIATGDFPHPIGPGFWEEG